MAQENVMPAPAPLPDAETDPAEAPGIPNVARLSRKRSRTRTYVIAGVGGVVALSLAGGASWLLLNHLKNRFPRPEVPRETPVGANGSVSPNFPAAPPAPAPAPAPAAATYTVPAPEGDELDARPVPLTHGTGVQTYKAPAPAPAPKRDPRDAPMMVISSAWGKGMTVSLVTVADRITPVQAADGMGEDIAQQRARINEQRQAIQAQIKDLMGRVQSGMQAQMPPAAPPPAAAASMPPDSNAGAARTNPLSTATVVAEQLPDKSLILPFGSNLQCQMLSRIATTARGSFQCLVARDVYGMDGRIRLIDAGSYVEGDYEAQNLPLGINAIPVLRPRLRTPDGIVFDLPGEVTGPMGEGGLPGYLDERWGRRLGPAVAMSLLSDTAKLLIARESDGATGNTVVIGGGTLQQGDRLAQDVGRRTLDIPPVFRANEGTTVFLHFKQNVDFSKVYALRPARR